MTMLEITLQMEGLLGAAGTLLSLGTTVLGLLVAYIAFRGYRRGSRPMLYVAVGFALVFVAPLVLFIGNVLLGGRAEFVFGLVGEASRFVGLICILYGIRVPQRTD
jgi:membrane-associated PAP2 superfamily phosphatase